MKPPLSGNELSQVWSCIPWEYISPTFQVDFCQLISGSKPAIRSRVTDRKALINLEEIAKSYNWDFALDEGEIFVMSTEKGISDTIIAVDNSYEPHEIELGTLLGYPACCSKLIASLGENEIDNYELEFNKKSKEGKYKLLDIESYMQGISLLSHVPCSQTCDTSFRLASNVKEYIERNRRVDSFSGWAEKVLDHYLD